MRTRETINSEIVQQLSTSRNLEHTTLQIEVIIVEILLDIRELLLKGNEEA